MKKYLKLRKCTFKNIHEHPRGSLVLHGLAKLQRSPHLGLKTPPSRISDSLHGFERTCQMPGGQPKVRKCPTLGTGNIRKCNAVARGGGGVGTAGIDGCITTRPPCLIRPIHEQ